MTSSAAARMVDPALAAQQLLTEYDETYSLGDIPPIPVADIAESLLMLDIVEEDEIRALPGAPADCGPLSGLLTTADQTIWVDRREAQRSRERRAVHGRPRDRALGSARAAWRGQDLRAGVRA